LSDVSGGVYLGTSAFAAAVLEALAGSPHRPALVVTPPDRPSGRGRRVSSPPAAEAARRLGIELHQTASVNDPASLDAIRARSPEVGVVCAFGQIVGEELLDELPLLNVHPSLLPRWRGAAPIERAIMAGDERTGVSVMRLTAGLDSGPVALREEVEIADGEDYGSLAERLAEIGGRLVIDALGRLGEGGLEFREQPEDGVTYAEKVEREERRLDPRGAASEEARRVRALTPHVGAFLELAGGDRLGVRDARATDGPAPAPGAVEVDADAECLVVGCDPGALAVATVQPPGGRWMSVADYLRGKPPPASVVVP
jgi:methionyl-tRNA formyltransferase